MLHGRPAKTADIACAPLARRRSTHVLIAERNFCLVIRGGHRALGRCRRSCDRNIACPSLRRSSCQRVVHRAAESLLGRARTFSKHAGDKQGEQPRGPGGGGGGAGSRARTEARRGSEAPVQT